jgi:hypothetical protein
MANGNHTGFTEIVAEDFVTQVSMGPIVDRSDEYLCSADQAIIRLRRHLLKAVRQFMADELPSSAAPEARDYSQITATGGRLESIDDDWRNLPR